MVTYNLPWARLESDHCSPPKAEQLLLEQENTRSHRVEFLEIMSQLSSQTLARLCRSATSVCLSVVMSDSARSVGSRLKTKLLTGIRNRALILNCIVASSILKESNVRKLVF